MCMLLSEHVVRMHSAEARLAPEAWSTRVGGARVGSEYVYTHSVEATPMHPDQVREGCCVGKGAHC